MNMNKRKFSKTGNDHKIHNIRVHPIGRFAKMEKAFYAHIHIYIYTYQLINKYFIFSGKI